MQNTQSVTWVKLISFLSLCFNTRTATGEESGMLQHAPSVVSCQVFFSDLVFTPHDLTKIQTQQRWRWCLTSKAFGMKDFIQKHVWIPPVPSSSAVCHILIATAGVFLIHLRLRTTEHSYLVKIIYSGGAMCLKQYKLLVSTYKLTEAELPTYPRFDCEGRKGENPP